MQFLNGCLKASSKPWTSNCTVRVFHEFFLQAHEVVEEIGQYIEGNLGGHWACTVAWALLCWLL
jgi:hypothetical protein